jgi:hypothetical protein
LFMSRSRSSSKRIAAICIAVAVVVGGGGAAFAYWSSTGTGTGTATTGTSAAFTVTSSAPTGPALVPDGDPQSVAFAVANPSTGTLDLVSVDVTVANADGTEWLAESPCSAADYVVSNILTAYGPIAGGANVAGTLDISLVDTGADQDACKGVIVPLYFVAS